MDRRKFLESSGSALLSAYFLSACRSLPPKSSAGPRAFVFLESIQGESTARIVDLKTLEHKDVQIPVINPHSAQRIQTGEYEFIVFDFMGTAVRANFLTGQVLKASAGTGVFMGHGVQTHSGELIWCTELSPEEGIRVRARRTSDLSLVGDSTGEFPGGHHVTRLPGSSILASGWFNLQERSSNVRFFDHASGKSSVTKLPDHITVSHLLPYSPTEVIGISNVLLAPGEKTKNWNKSPLVRSTYATVKGLASESASRGQLDLDPGAPAPLVYANLNGESRLFWPQEEAEKFRYGFSIDVVPGSPGQFVTCHTLSHNVVLWSGTQVNQYISVPSPKGAVAAPDGKKLVILTQGVLKLWSIPEKKFVDEIRFERPVSTLSRYS